MALADYQTLVTSFHRDDAGKIATADRDRAIEAARERYSRDRPRLKVEDAAAPGGNLLDLAPAWEADFSELRSLETPIGSVPPNYLRPESWSLYEAPTGTTVMLENALAAGTDVRWTFTVRHLLDAVDDTIPVQDREAVASYAAAILLDELAAFYSGQTDSTIQADGVDHRSRAAEYAARARGFRKKYFDELGIDDKRSVAAGVVKELPKTDSRGHERLTHPYWRT